MSQKLYPSNRPIPEVRYRVRAQAVEALSYICGHPLFDNKIIVFNTSSLESIVIKKALWDRLPTIFDQALGKQVSLLQKKGRVIHIEDRQ